VRWPIRGVGQPGHCEHYHEGSRARPIAQYVDFLCSPTSVFSVLGFFVNCVGEVVKAVCMDSYNMDVDDNISCIVIRKTGVCSLLRLCVTFSSRRKKK
jgi:hypothetical protein